MTTAKRITKGPSLEILEALLEGLEEVEAVLPGRLVPDDDAGEGEYDEEDPSIEAEEIEVFTDGVVSVINDLRGKKREAKSFADVFAILFGEQSKTVAIAEDFENASNGYFGNLFGTDLERSQQLLSELIESVKERIEKWKKNNPNLFA